jgi:hypothetical protein
MGKLNVILPAEKHYRVYQKTCKHYNLHDSAAY